MYTSQRTRTSGQWNKIAALRAVMAAAPHHDWIWMLDSDAFIMEQSIRLQEVRGSWHRQELPSDLEVLLTDARQISPWGIIEFKRWKF